MTRLLAIADKEDDVLCARLERREVGYVDAVISCGDLDPSYLDYVATMAHAPLLYVLGNHDTNEDAFVEMGGDHLDGRIVRIGGLRIAGLDGSLDYRDGIVGFSEREMRVKAMRLAMLATLTGGIDVLVTHAPVRGHGDLDDRPHQGFECFNWLLNLLHPKALLHGHVHLDYGMIQREVSHPSGTRVINAYSHYLVEDL